MSWAPHPGWHDVLGHGLSWLPWHCRHASSVAFQSTDVWPPVWQHYPAAPDIPHTAERDRTRFSTKNRNDNMTPTLISKVKKMEVKSAVTAVTMQNRVCVNILDDVQPQIRSEKSFDALILRNFQSSGCSLVQCDCVHVNTRGSGNVK